MVSSKHTKGIGIQFSGRSDSSGWPQARVIPLGCLVNVNGMSIKCAVELAHADWCSLVVDERRKRRTGEDRNGKEGFDVPEGALMVSVLFKALLQHQHLPTTTTNPGTTSNPKRRGS